MTERPLPSGVEWFWVDDGFACGAIGVRAGVVVECAPIWRRRWKGCAAKGFPYKQARRLA